MFDLSYLLAGGVVFGGLVASLWSRIKTLGSMLLGRVIVRANLEDAVADAVTSYCWHEYKCSRFSGLRRFVAFSSFVRPVGRYLNIAAEAIGTEPLLFWVRRRPLLLKYTLPAGNYAVGSPIPLTITFIRGTFDLDALIFAAMTRYAAIAEAGDGATRFSVFRVTLEEKLIHERASSFQAGETPTMVATKLNGVANWRVLHWKSHELGTPLASGDPLSALAMTSEMAQVVEAAVRWKASEQWYKQRLIPWRLGLGFYGLPGTGKTTMAIGLAQRLDIPVHVFDLSTFNNRELVQHWQAVLRAAPAMVLLEDIDAVFDGRENITGTEHHAGVTYDCLLNCISGAEDSSGILIVITTNRIEKLDDALGRPDPERGGISRRPGRIDWMIELPILSAEGRRKLAKRILCDWPEKIEQLVAQGEGDTGAQFQERCVRIALDYYWEPSADTQYFGKTRVHDEPVTLSFKSTFGT